MVKDDRSPGRVAIRWVFGGAAVLLALGLCLVIAAAALSYRVDGHSMRPTLLNDERIVLDPFADKGAVQRFDVVAVRRPGDGRVTVKRVIGLPGDRIEIAPEPGADATVRVRPAGSDGWRTVESPIWRDRWGDSLPCCHADGTEGAREEAVVPDEQLFVIGDNPAGSDDSREFGWVPSAEVVGHVWLRVYPLDRAGELDSSFILSID